MTDPTGLPPEQEAVRRLLADARHDGSTPPEVVDRLDAVLASLAAERSESSPAETAVVDLGARRRRTAGIGLLAAAAVVVAGVAIGQGLPPMQGGSDAGSTAEGGATSQRESSDDSGGGAGADSGGAAESEERSPQQKETFLEPGLAGLPELYTFDEELDDELLDLRAAARPSSAASEPAGPGTGCEVDGVGRGRQVVAEIDGGQGLVVFRRPDGARQQVDLYLCGDPTAVRTLTLPAP